MLGTSTILVEVPGLKCTISLFSATYIVSPRNAIPNGRFKPLATTTTESATPSWFASGRRTTIPAPVRDAYTTPPGPSARDRTPGTSGAHTVTWNPAGTGSGGFWPSADGPLQARATRTAESAGRRMGYLRLITVTLSSSLPSGSTRTSVGGNGRSTRADVSAPLTATSRRSVLPSAARNSSVNAGIRNRPHSGFWR